MIPTIKIVMGDRIYPSIIFSCKTIEQATITKIQMSVSQQT